MKRNLVWWLTGGEAFSLHAAVTTKTWDDAWGTDGFPLTLSAVQKLWAPPSLFTWPEGPLKTLPVYRESSRFLGFRDRLSLEGCFWVGEGAVWVLVGFFFPPLEG